MPEPNPQNFLNPKSDPQWSLSFATKSFNIAFAPDSGDAREVVGYDNSSNIILHANSGDAVLQPDGSFVVSNLSQPAGGFVSIWELAAGHWYQCERYPQVPGVAPQWYKNNKAQAQGGPIAATLFFTN